MICESTYGIWFLIAYSVFEFWLGRTKKTRANSMIEIVGIAIGFVIVKLITKEKGNGKSV